MNNFVVYVFFPLWSLVNNVIGKLQTALLKDAPSGCRRPMESLMPRSNNSSACDTASACINTALTV